MPNDLPDWSQNASIPGQTIALAVATPSSVTPVALPNRAAAVLLDVLTTNFTAISVVGLTSGEVYLSLSNPVPGSRVAIVTDSRDSQVNVNLAHNVGIQTDTADVSFMPSAVIAMLAQGSVVDVTDRSGRLLGNVNSIVLPVTLSATPQLWQAPRAYAAGELAAVGSTVLVTGVVNQTVRLFGWWIEIDQASAASIAWLEDTTSPAGTVAARLAGFANASNGGVAGHEGGKPVTLGQGIRLNVPALGAGGVVRVGIGYSQG